jgi:hypothetical protein
MSLNGANIVEVTTLMATKYMTVLLLSVILDRPY